MTRRECSLISTSTLLVCDVIGIKGEKAMRRNGSTLAKVEDLLPHLILPQKPT